MSLNHATQFPSRYGTQMSPRRRWSGHIGILAAALLAGRTSCWHPGICATGVQDCEPEQVTVPLGDGEPCRLHVSGAVGSTRRAGGRTACFRDLDPTVVRRTARGARPCACLRSSDRTVSYQPRRRLVAMTPCAIEPRGSKRTSATLSWSPTCDHATRRANEAAAAPSDTSS